MKVASLLAALVFVYITTIAVCFVGSEHNVYYWDMNGYWSFWQDFSKQLFAEPGQAFLTLLRSIQIDDYNLLPAAILSFANVFQLESRLLYILAAFFVYFIPSGYVFLLLNARISEKRDSYIYLLSLVIFVSSAPFWVPTLRGYPDIAGLFFVISAIFYGIKVDFTEKVKIREAVTLGFLLWSAFLMRRWYAYTVVSLCISLPLLNYSLSKIGISNKLHALKSISINALLAGIAIVMFLVVFQLPLIGKIISTDYSDIYSAYQSSISDSIVGLIDNFGLLVFPVLLFSVAAIARSRSRRQYIFLSFCLFNLVFSFLLFTRTQSPAVHHLIPFSFWIILVTTQGIYTYVGSLSTQAAKTSVVVAVFVGSSLVLVNTLFSPATLAWLDTLSPSKALPVQVENIDEYLSLRDDILEFSEDGGKIGVFSSSTVLNGDMLSSLSNRKIDRRMAHVAHVDLRDGINFSAFDARYAVIATPPQIHLDSKQQKVITIPVDAIVSGKNIGNAYDRVPREYHLGKNVSASIYVKKRPFSYEELREFLDAHYRYHPQWKGKYESSLGFAFLGAQIENGDVWGDFRLAGNDIIYAHPGASIPTSAVWSLNNFPALHIESINTSCNADDSILIGIEAPGYQDATFELQKGGSITLDTGHLQDVRWKLSIAKNKSAYCGSVAIRRAE